MALLLPVPCPFSSVQFRSVPFFLARTLCFALLEAREGVARQPTSSERHVCRSHPVLCIIGGSRGHSPTADLIGAARLPLTPCVLHYWRLERAQPDSRQPRRGTMPPQNLNFPRPLSAKMREYVPCFLEAREGVSPTADNPAAARCRQIGRASCRERVFV